MKHILDNEIVRRDFTILRFRMRTLFWGPFLVGTGVLFFLSAVPQTREVYLGVLEGIYQGDLLQIFQALFGVALIFLLCLLLHAWQRMLGTAAVDRIYPEHADVVIDRKLISWRNFLSSFSALLPMLGLAIGLGKTIFEASQAGAQFQDVLKFFDKANWQETFKEFKTTTEVLPFYDKSGMMILLIIAALTLVMMIYGRSWIKHLLGRNIGWLYSAIFTIGGLVTVLAFLAPIACDTCIVGVTRIMGPLAAAAILLISFTSILVFLSYLSHRLRWPITGAAVLAVLGVLVYLTYEALTPRDAKLITSSPPPVNEEKPALLGQFDEWLAERKDLPRFQNSDYPVFIIAAQGGGIYAAAATSAFLADMQDTCPAFAQHVFAISAVSGGAVGSAIFDALLEAKGEGATTGDCRLDATRSGSETLSEATKRVVRDDHLSPAVALIWPDIGRKMMQFFHMEAEFNRASALERSFACSLEPPETRQFACGTPSGTGLGMAFLTHWSPQKSTPALVLTSTWVETGFRAAFSPFKLHGLSDGTLFSFPLEKKVDEDDFEIHGIDVLKPYEHTLIGATMVSARFPGIVPAYTIEASTKDWVLPRKWNFVDGGYVDNSGASTASDIYRALQKHVKGKRVRLYLVLMTDANTDPNLRDVDNGTSFSDTVAPITALLSVRGQLSGRAVTRAIEQVQAFDELDQKATVGDLVGRTLVDDKRSSPVLVVNLKQDTFNLPLGWKISGTTDDIVRLMLGRRDLCKVDLKDIPKEELKSVISVIGNNSCVKERIIDLLNAEELKNRTDTAN